MSSNFSFYESAIRRLAARPVREVRFSAKTIRVFFEDGTDRSAVFDPAMRMFLVSMQGVEGERRQGGGVPCPLGRHFHLLGWNAGDAVELQRDGCRFAIEFS